MAESLKTFIDKYWEMEVQEHELIEYIKQVVENNEELMYKDNDYTAILKQKLGVKRLGLISKILKSN